MRILQIITDTNIGGAGRLLINYLEHLDYSKFEVYVAVPENSLLIPMIESTGSKIIKTKYGKDKSYELTAVNELIEIIKRIMPDVVHTHASLSGRIAATKCNVKLRVMTKHCAFPNNKLKTIFPLRNILGAYNNHYVDVYIATANIVKKQLLEIGCSEKKITIIHNGTEKLKKLPDKRNSVRTSLGIPKNAFVVGMSARLELYKGQKVLLEAANLLKEHNIYYMFIGGGRSEAELKYEAKKLGISNKVIFIGYSNKVNELYSAIDLHVNCSTVSETTSLSILETMSMGIPNVVSDVGGNPDVVDDGINGYVVKSGDANALRDAILKMYYDSDTYYEFVENSEAKFDREYRIDDVVNKLEKVYLGGINESSYKKIN